MYRQYSCTVYFDCESVIFDCALTLYGVTVLSCFHLDFVDSISCLAKQKLFVTNILFSVFIYIPLY